VHSSGATDAKQGLSLEPTRTRIVHRCIDFSLYIYVYGRTVNREREREKTKKTISLHSFTAQSNLDSPNIHFVRSRKCVSDTEGHVGPLEFFERLKDTTLFSLFLKDSLGEFVTRKLFSMFLKETCIPTRPPSLYRRRKCVLCASAHFIPHRGGSWLTIKVVTCGRLWKYGRAQASQDIRRIFMLMPECAH
jgi:hypothetical protein